MQRAMSAEKAEGGGTWEGVEQWQPGYGGAGSESPPRRRLTVEQEGKSPAELRQTDQGNSNSPIAGHHYFRVVRTCFQK